MLIAKDSKGKLISLYKNKLAKHELLKLRREQSFYCPACIEEVILKLGDKQAWHFAHKQKLSCSAELEGETNYHIKGKKLLLEWLVNQRFQVQLEPYLKQIKQRPDLLVQLNEINYAIEFQCAKISHQDFLKRTRTFQEHHYTPIWILGGSQLKRLNTTLFHLNSFHWLFTSYPQSINKLPQLLTFCPINHQFIKLNNIVALSPTRALCQPTFHSISGTAFTKIIEQSNVANQSENWFYYKMNWRKYRQNLCGAQQFLRKLYLDKGLPYTLFPSEAGLPVYHQHFIETPTYIWQSWILEIFIVNKAIGSKFHFNLVKRAFHSLVNRGIFKLRKQPLMKVKGDDMALKNYLLFLVHLNVLTTKDEHIFFKNKHIVLPKTEAQALEMDQFVEEKFLRYTKLL